ncbi:MAG: DNA repair protein RecO C-terminal domain-containing protein [Bacteroidales bacterium]|nr:DNA repair protein RecO C-terminal domain-containing protein [Bacteroidales bacterium]
MPSVAKSRIVVLHLTKYSDHSLILHTVDSAAGRRSFLVRGLKRSNAVALFHPLSLLDVVSGESPKSSLAWLREWEPAASLPGLRGDRTKAAIAMFLSEVLYRSFTTELADLSLFDWLCDAIVRLDAAEGSVANFHLWFLVGYAVQLGFMPGEAVEPAGMFSPDDAALFQQILHASFEETMAIPLSATRRQAFARRMLQYLSWHLGTTLDARSLDVLHAVLA